MEFDPTFPIPLIAALAAAAALAALARQLRGGSRPLAPRWLAAPAVLLRLAAIAVLGWLLLNPSERIEAPAAGSRPLFLVDGSDSMGLRAGAGGPSRWEEATAWVGEASAGLGEARAVVFAAEAGPRLPVGGLAGEPPGGPTNLSAALERVAASASGAGPGEVPDPVIVVSDGRARDRGALGRALRAARQAGLTVSAHAVGSDAPPRNAWIEAVQVPQVIRPRAAVAAKVRVEATGFAPGDLLVLSVRDAGGRPVAEGEVLLRETGGGPLVGEAVLAFEGGLRSAGYRLDLAAPGAPEIDRADNGFAFTLEVASTKLRVLFVEGTHAKRSVGGDGHFINDMELMTRAWEESGEIEHTSLTALDSFVLDASNLFGVSFSNGEMAIDTGVRFPRSREDVYAYDVIIISDINVKNFAAEQIGWVSDFVTERGGGLLMAGGISSFDSGQYDRTPWEKLIPVDMLGFGAGFYDRLLTLDIPDTVKDHPLWKLDSDPEKNAEILAAHPPFFGMNRVRRAKPGAVVLALRAGTDEPVIAAQTYGRGRSVAYLPDPNGGWGDRYATWGPSGVVTGERIEIGQGAEFIFSSDAARVPATPVPPHPSPWYGRYWVNMVKWLGERSVRWRNEKLAGRAVGAYAQPGEPLRVAAEALAVIDPARVPDLDVGARLDLPGAGRVRLEYDRDRREFLGEVPVPAEIGGGEVALVFDAGLGGGEAATDQVRVGVRRTNPEFTRPAPDAEFLRELSEAGGGRLLGSPGEAAALAAEVAGRRARAGARAWAQPQWARWGPWALLAALLCAEWAIRRWGARQAPALAASEGAPLPPAMAKGATSLSMIVAALVAAPPNLLAQDDPAPPPLAPDEKIAALIEQLGNKRVRLRDDADEKLRAMPEAREAVKAAAARSGNEEARLRAERIYRHLFERQWEIEFEDRTTSDGEPTDPVRGVVLSPDGKTFYTRSVRRITAWGVQRGNKVWQGGINRGRWEDWQKLLPVGMLAVSPDGRLLVTSDGFGQLTLLDARFGGIGQQVMNGEPYESPIEMLNDPQNNLRLMTGAQFFADGQRLVVSGRDGTVRIWTVDPLEAAKTIDIGDGDLICTVRLSPDEKRVAFCIDRGSPEDFVCLWDLEGDRLLSRLSSPRINAFAFTKDGKTLYGPSRGGRFYAWSVADGGLSEPKEITVLGTEAMGIILSADEKSAFIATDAKGGQIVQVRLEDGEWLWASPPLARRVEFLAWLDGDRFVSTSRDGQVTIWRKQNP